MYARGTGISQEQAICKYLEITLVIWATAGYLFTEMT